MIPVGKTYITYRVDAPDGAFYCGSTYAIDGVKRRSYWGAGTAWRKHLRDKGFLHYHGGRFVKSVLTFTILEHYNTIEEAREAEVALLKSVIGTPGCMNRTIAGGGRKRPVTEEEKAALAKARRNPTPKKARVHQEVIYKAWYHLMVHKPGKRFRNTTKSWLDRALAAEASLKEMKLRRRADITRMKEIRQVTRQLLQK